MSAQRDCIHGHLARSCELCAAQNDHATACEQIDRLRAELAALRAERDALRAALIEATEMVEHWGGYASDYFQKKWNLEGDLTKLRAAIAAESQS